MLSKLGRRRLSIHKIFLTAPDEVVSAIALYVKGVKHEKSERLLRGYIQSHLPTLDYSCRVDESSLCHQGAVYNVFQIYQNLNKLYFGGKLNLQITWYGRAVRKRRSKVIFGEYHDALRLVKIHRILDDAFFPDYFVSFIVYHEMVHHIVAGKFDSKGTYRVHTAEFKARERLFQYYEKAVKWEKANKEKIFGWA